MFYQKGTKYAMANIEYRFPILMAFATGGVPLIIQGIMGNFFFDIGTSFNDTKSFQISRIDPMTNQRVPGNVLMSTG
jgi:outer membrane protein assembly factor BamA